MLYYWQFVSLPGDCPTKQQVVASEERRNVLKITLKGVDMRFFNEPNDERFCGLCDDKDKNLESMKEWFKKTLEMLYEGNKLDEGDLEHCLDEVAYHLGMKIPETEIQVMRKEKKIYPHPVLQAVDEWKQLNNQYFKKLNNVTSGR